MGMEFGFGDDVEGQFGGTFGEKSVRQGFIRKVYGILSCQLLITCAIISIFVFVDEVQQWSKENEWLYITSLVVTLALIIAMACSTNLRRNFPTNIICLGVFTVLEGIMLGSVSAHFSAKEVFLAMAVTAIIVIVLTLFAFQTKIEFTTMSGSMLVVLLAFILIGICFSFWGGKTVYLIYCGFGVIIFGIFIVIDTQLMIGGKHKYALDPEEYIFAALNLYLDIVNIFIYLLAIFGIGKD